MSDLASSIVAGAIVALRSYPQAIRDTLVVRSHRGGDIVAAGSEEVLIPARPDIPGWLDHAYEIVRAAR